MEFLREHWKAVMASAVVVSGAAIFYCGRKKLKEGCIIREKATGPLAGLRVLDLSNVVAGPWAAALLSELGAEVIKVESMTPVDSARGLGTAPIKGMAGCFAHSARGKQSVWIDLKSKDGKAVFFKLVEEVDIVLQNFRPGAVERMGISYEDCKKCNEQIIYLSSSGFGPSGPLAQSKIYDPVTQANAGIAAAQDEETPTLLAQAAFDKVTALTSAQAIMAAVYARAEGAGGQHITVSMLEAALYFMWPDCFGDHTWLEQQAQESTSWKQYGPWSIKQAMEEQGLRCRISEQQPLAPSDCAAAPTFSKHLQPTQKHLLFGGHRAAKFPVTFSKETLQPRPVAPMFGEHTVKILREAKYSKAEIQKLLDEKSVTSTKSMLLQRGAEMKSKARVFGILEMLQGGPSFFDSTRIEGAKKVKHAASPLCAQEKRDSSGPMSTSHPGALRVVEASSLLAGPMAACILADQGAQVLKLEDEAKQDPSRKLGGMQNGCSSMYIALNRNKKTVLCSNLKQKVLEEIAKSGTDVLIYDTDTVDLSDAEIAAANGQIVSICIDRCDETHAQNLTGVTIDQQIAQKHRNPSEVQVATNLCEKVTAYYAAFAVVAALFKGRSRAGSTCGEQLHLSMEGAAVHFSMPDVMWSNTWLKPKEPPAFPQCSVIFRTFECKDGISCFSGALSDDQYLGWMKEFKEAVDAYVEKHPELDLKKKINGPWKTMVGRLVDIAGLWDLFGFVVKYYPFEEYNERANKCGAFCARVHTLREAITQPQVQHDNTIQKLQHPDFGSLQVARPPARFAEPTYEGCGQSDALIYKA
jgi:crotonobetainyl-CoA:carnitine CoA-transferase CaiB-like acyl-CoA transferase